MSTDEEKSRLAKLLGNIDVPEQKLPERCFDIVKDFRKKFSDVVNKEEGDVNVEDNDENPYKVDSVLLEETERKLRLLLAENKRLKKQPPEAYSLDSNKDSKRPWRTNTGKEKLLRINNELKRHHEKSLEAIPPLADSEMDVLIKQCMEHETGEPKLPLDKLRDCVDSARKQLPQFQYRKVENSTATMIFPEAHNLGDNNEERVVKENSE